MTLTRAASTSAQALAMELGITDTAKKAKAYDLILALLTLERERDGWQPIETAPKDWSDVLLFVPELDSDWRKVCEGYYDAEGEVWLNPMFGAVEPTHWKPLPSLPGASE